MVHQEEEEEGEIIVEEDEDPAEDEVQANSAKEEIGSRVNLKRSAQAAGQQGRGKHKSVIANSHGLVKTVVNNQSKKIPLVGTHDVDFCLEHVRIQ